MSTTKLPSPPPEPTRISTVLGLAPAFQSALGYTFDDLKDLGYKPTIFESLRTEERQSWLFGFGRLYDDPQDPRGIVTHVTANKSWHFYGLAADVVPAEGSKSAGFYPALARAATSFGLTSGYNWQQQQDPPHVQWHCPGMLVSPSDHAVEIYARGGKSAVWRALHAD